MTNGGIAIQGVSRSFGDVAAVSNATLTALPGRITGLIGPNGAGKTTLMLMIATLLRPDAGSILVDGASPVDDTARAREALGWMPDGLGAWPTLTCREILTVTGRLYALDRASASTRADELLATVRLSDLAERPARVLSRGQKQRLGLARALMHSPRVLVLDEPASGLDPQARIDLRALLRGFAADGGTVLVSSHVLSELDEMIDDAIFMRAGTVVDDPTAHHTGTTWRMRSASPSPDDPARVAAALGVPVASITTDRETLLIALDSETAAAAALSRIVGAGVPVVEYAPALGRLERAFLALEGDR